MSFFIGEVLKGWREKNSKQIQGGGRLFHAEDMLLQVSLAAGSCGFQNPLTPSSWGARSRYCQRQQRRSQGLNWGLPFPASRFGHWSMIKPASC